MWKTFGKLMKIKMLAMFNTVENSVENSVEKSRTPVENFFTKSFPQFPQALFLTACGNVENFLLIVEINGYNTGQKILYLWKTFLLITL